MGTAGAVRERDGGGQENGVQPTGDLRDLNTFVHIEMSSDSSFL